MAIAVVLIIIIAIVVVGILLDLTAGAAPACPRRLQRGTCTSSTELNQENQQPRQHVPRRILNDQAGTVLRSGRTRVQGMFDCEFLSPPF